MKLKTNYIAVVISLNVILILAMACAKKPPEQTVSRTGVPLGIYIALPRNVTNAEPEPAVLKESAVTLSVPEKSTFYVGRERFPKDELSFQISRLLKGQTEANRIVYVAGGALNDYGDVVAILDSARKEGVVRIGLLVDQQSSSGDAPSLFRVQIPAEPDPNEDLSKLKPNPLTLVVSISPDLKLELNRQPAGTADDTATLTQTLTRVFQERRAQRAYKPGMETRTDVPEEERVERTIVVKAQRSTPYGRVVRLIDALKGAGANPIVLQIDDLPQ